MKVTTIDELDTVLALVSKHRIDVLELEGCRIVRAVHTDGYPIDPGAGLLEGNVALPMPAPVPSPRRYPWRDAGEEKDPA